MGYWCINMIKIRNLSKLIITIILQRLDIFEKERNEIVIPIKNKVVHSTLKISN